jgi:hypothetical protein
MTTDVRLTSGLTRTVLFFGGSPFFWEKMEKNTFFSLETGPLGGSRGTVCLPYTTGGMHSQNKHTDSRFSLLQDNSPRYGRGSQHEGNTRHRS